LSLSALIFIVAFIAGCGLALSRHPIFGLLTYVGVFYVHPPSRWWGQGPLLDFRWAFIAAGVTLLALLIHKPTVQLAPVFRSSAFWAFAAFIGWISVQSYWALDPVAHADLRSIYIKFLFVIVMICRSVETEQHLRWLLWSHVLGCFYLGFLAYTSYGGGRLDGVGGPGIDEANAAALQMVTGVIVAGSLFLAGNWSVRGVLLLLIPFMVNGLISTISRSGFLAAAVGGLVYNWFTPGRFRLRVGVVSGLALVLFLMLTNDVYWERISTIQLKGQEVEGVDTGGGRLEIIDAQWRMFEGRPFGCGHMCTTVLSPSYVDEKHMAREGGRASHNTFMTMLVDHGIVGGVFYFTMLLWIYRSLRKVAHRLQGQRGFMPAIVPAVAAVFGAITIGDLFVQYPKLEVRVWFVSILIVMLHLTAAGSSADKSR
jgi:hypothetical protein